MQPLQTARMPDLPWYHSMLPKADEPKHSELTVDTPLLSELLERPVTPKRSSGKAVRVLRALQAAGLPVIERYYEKQQCTCGKVAARVCFPTSRQSGGRIRLTDAARAILAEVK